MNNTIIGLIVTLVGVPMVGLYFEYGTPIPFLQKSSAIQADSPIQASSPMQMGLMSHSQAKDYANTVQRPPWCQNQLNRAERIICDTPSLWKVEAKSRQVYYQLYNASSSSEKKDLKSELIQWLKPRNAECLRSVEACLEVYQRRIRDLEYRL
jgi:uncharacterized protein YecT (DUF1311 family)